MPLAALIAGGSSLLGGLFSNRSKKKAAAQQYENDLKQAAQQNKYDIEREARQSEMIERTEKERFKWLVEGAESAGFNPLTVLGATGGAMGQTANAAGMTAPGKTAPISTMGDSIAQAGANFAAYMGDPIAKQTEKLRNELLTKQIDQIDRENLRFGQPVTRQTSSPVKTRGPRTGHISGPDNPSTRPWPRVDRVLVRSPYGVNFNVPADVAKRNRWNRGDSLTQGDVAELIGESTEVVAGLTIDTVLERMAQQGIITDKLAPVDEEFPLMTAPSREGRRSGSFYSN